MVRAERRFVRGQRPLVQLPCARKASVRLLVTIVVSFYLYPFARVLLAVAMVNNRLLVVDATVAENSSTRLAAATVVGADDLGLGGGTGQQEGGSNYDRFHFHFVLGWCA